MLQLYRFTENLFEHGQWGVSEWPDTGSLDLMTALARGERVAAGTVLPYEVIHPGIPWDISFGAVGTPIVTKRAADVMTAVAPGDLQAIPAAPKSTGSVHGTPDLSIAKCLDVNLSKFSGPAERPSSVTTPVIRRAMIGDMQIFRVATFQALVIVTERFKRAIEDAGLKGAWFKPVDAV